jgi:hypothetical protein
MTWTMPNLVVEIIAGIVSAHIVTIAARRKKLASEPGKHCGTRRSAERRG